MMVGDTISLERYMELRNIVLGTVKYFVSSEYISDSDVSILLELSKLRLSMVTNDDTRAITNILSREDSWNVIYLLSDLHVLLKMSKTHTVVTTYIEYSNRFSANVDIISKEAKEAMASTIEEFEYRLPLVALIMFRNEIREYAKETREIRRIEND